MGVGMVFKPEEDATAYNLDVANSIVKGKLDSRLRGNGWRYGGWCGLSA